MIAQAAENVEKNNLETFPFEVGAERPVYWIVSRCRAPCAGFCLWSVTAPGYNIPVHNTSDSLEI